MSDVQLKMDKLNKLVKSMKGKIPSAIVGIFPKNNARSDSAVKNATIGAIYEFGTSSKPQRSFLRVPLEDNLGKQVQAQAEKFKDTIGEVIKTSSLLPWAELMGDISLKVVRGAFDTSGYGKWKPFEKGGSPLVETGQLRDSVSYEVIT